MIINREEDLYQIWENFCKRGDQTADLRLRGVYSGRLNRFAGPDFQGAEFELEGNIYRGDVEIHVRTRDWYDHHHHLDKNYDNVLLHLVLDEDDEIYVNNSQMQKITTLGFRNFPRYTTSENNQHSCDHLNITGVDIEALLKKLAFQRLNSKVLSIRKSAEKMTYDQVIFYHLMGLMGKPHNELNFKHLASILPWENLMSLKYNYKLTKIEWLALLAMKSGLISSEPEFHQLKTLSHKIGSISSTQELESKVWQFSGQRPHNKPARQIKILANWLYHFKGRSIYHTIKSVLVERIAYSKMISELSALFRTDSTAQSHPSTVDNWGKAQIIEFIGNVVIPFYYWEAEFQSHHSFQDYLCSLYFTLPVPMPYAKIKSLSSMLIHSGFKSGNFYIQQGLITIKDNFCDQDRCPVCPFAKEYKDIDKICENI